MYTIRETRRGSDRTEKSILATGPALERGVPALLGVSPIYCAHRQHSFAKREVMRLPAHSCGQSSRPPPIGDWRLQFGHVQPAWRNRLVDGVAGRMDAASAHSFVYGAFTEDLQGWHSVGQSPRNPPIGDRRVQSGPGGVGAGKHRQHRFVL